MRSFHIVLVVLILSIVSQASFAAEETTPPVCRSLASRILIGTVKAPFKAAAFPSRTWKRAALTVGTVGALTYFAWPRQAIDGPYSPLVNGIVSVRDWSYTGGDNTAQIDALNQIRKNLSQEQGKSK